MATDALVGISTAGSEEEARKIAKILVGSKAAACVNVMPGVTSFFYWDGKLCEEKESLLLIKTTKGKSDEVIDIINKNHSYEVPEVIFSQVEEGEKRYLEWVRQAVS